MNVSKLNLNNMSSTQSFLLQIVAFFILWIAVDYKRPSEYRFDLFSKDGAVQFLLITVAGIILTNC
jgi:hypothetical protein